MIVIPENCKDAMASTQFSEEFGTGRRVLPLLGNVITRQGHNVGLQTVRCLDRAFDLRSAGEGTVVYVGKLDYAKAVKSGWQTLQVNLVVFDCKPERLSEGRPRCLAEIKRQSAQGRFRPA